MASEETWSEVATISSTAAPPHAPMARKVLADQSIDVYITALGGEVVAQFRTGLETNVASLRRRIYELSGIPCNEQRLLLGRETLGDHHVVGALACSTEQICISLIRLLQPRALSGSADGELRLWELDTGMCSRCFPTPSAVLCITVDWVSRIALSGHSDGVFRLWDLDRGGCLRELQDETANGIPRCVALNWCTKIAVSGCPLKKCGLATSHSEALDLVLWDLAHGRRIRGFSTVSSAASVSLEVDWCRLHVLVGGGNSLSLLDLETGDAIFQLSALAPLQTMAVDWAAQLALTGGCTGILQLWDLDGQSCCHELQCEGSVKSLAIDSAIMQGVAAGSDINGKLVHWIWNLHDGSLLRALIVPVEGPAQCLALNVPRGLSLSSFVSGGWAGDERVCDALALTDLASGHCCVELVGHTDHVYCAVIG